MVENMSYSLLQWEHTVLKYCALCTCVCVCVLVCDYVCKGVCISVRPAAGISRALPPQGSISQIITRAGPNTDYTGIYPILERGRERDGEGGRGRERGRERARDSTGEYCIHICQFLYGLVLWPRKHPQLS